MRVRKADDALLKAAIPLPYLGSSLNFLQIPSKASAPQSKSGSSLVEAIWFQEETRCNCKLLTKLFWFLITPKQAEMERMLM